MQDTIIKGTGNSRTLRSVASFMNLYPTYEDFVAALVTGTLPIDIGPLNSAGVQQTGTAVNKANLLSDATATVLSLTGNPTVNDALNKLGASVNTANANVRKLQLGVETTFQKLITGRLV